jgi:hypothetical protein
MGELGQADVRGRIKSAYELRELHQVATYEVTNNAAHPSRRNSNSTNVRPKAVSAERSFAHTSLPFVKAEPLQCFEQF